MEVCDIAILQQMFQAAHAENVRVRELEEKRQRDKEAREKADKEKQERMAKKKQLVDISSGNSSAHPFLLLSIPLPLYLCRWPFIKHL